jgi:hypothetical protein
MLSAFGLISSAASRRRPGSAEEAAKAPATPA